ncbi:hypothetical protein PIIN_03580 [Serendipita indica DSM 11827]|uniref:Uncharacterized protein n=1 Tax=Serendipita indica (strain DSM 11827) TaxID=1109443 RepID=G4TE82_SERID|nr:hypothetical protein PIIN_03580 [Serendipita indica DSM 11827]
MSDGDTLVFDGKIAHLVRAPTKLPVLRHLSPHASVWTTTAIVATLLAACTAAVGHHFTLAYLDGRPIGSTTEQFWIKNASNAFGYVVAFSLSFVTTQTLAQAVWKAASTQNIRVSTLDDLFSLPSPPALLRLVFPRPQSIHFLPPIIYALFFHLLVAIGIFAPNALTTTGSARRWQELVVPTLDLSSGRITSISYPDMDQYTNVTVEWHDLVLSLVDLASQPPHLNVGNGCNVECGYTVQYEAPALTCGDLAESEVGIQAFHVGDSGLPTIYAGTTSLYPAANPEVGGSYDLGVPYSWAEYGRDTKLYISNTRCDVPVSSRDLSTGFSTEEYTTNHHHHAPGDGRCIGEDTTCHRSTILKRDADSSGGDCWTRGVNYRALTEMFARAFAGTIDYHMAPTSTLDGKPYFSRHLQSERAVARLFVADEPDEMAFYLSPRLSLNGSSGDGMDSNRLKEVLASTMANVTLGLIAQRSDVTQTSVEVWDGESVWRFTAKTLWMVYAPALIVSSWLAAYGLWCIYAHGPCISPKSVANDGGVDGQGEWSGVALDASFSTILLATRGRGIDRLCSRAQTLEDVLEAQLCYSRRDAVFRHLSKEG